MISAGANSYAGCSPSYGTQSAYQFAYDGLGSRYQHTANSQTTNYTIDLSGDLSQVLADGTDTYFYGLNRIAQQSATNAWEYYLPDALGSVRQVADANGMVTLAQAFDPFGNSIWESGSSSGNYGFAGEWTDATGLQSLRARYYSTQQGRFISEDPFQGVLTQPASLAPYVYALNNPVLYTDPSGEIVPIFAIAGIGFAAGAIYDAYQQTNGFSNFCGYNIAQTLAMGVGGAAAATSTVIMTMSGVGMVGMGLQGVALGLSSLGLSGSILTSTFIAGNYGCRLVEHGNGVVVYISTIWSGSFTNHNCFSQAITSKSRASCQYFSL